LCGIYRPNDVSVTLHWNLLLESSDVRSDLQRVEELFPRHQSIEGRRDDHGDPHVGVKDLRANREPTQETESWLEEIGHLVDLEAAWGEAEERRGEGRGRYQANVDNSCGNDDDDADVVVEAGGAHGEDHEDDLREEWWWGELREGEGQDLADEEEGEVESGHLCGDGGEGDEISDSTRQDKGEVEEGVGTWPELEQEEVK
jgi:hypothetical protein